jgi:hypothetical protein
MDALIRSRKLQFKIHVQENMLTTKCKRRNVFWFVMKTIYVKRIYSVKHYNKWKISHCKRQFLPEACLFRLLLAFLLCVGIVIGVRKLVHSLQAANMTLRLTCQVRNIHVDRLMSIKWSLISNTTASGSEICFLFLMKISSGGFLFQRCQGCHILHLRVCFRDVIKDVTYVIYVSVSELLRMSHTLFTWPAPSRLSHQRTKLSSFSRPWKALRRCSRHAWLRNQSSVSSWPVRVLLWDVSILNLV